MSKNKIKKSTVVFWFGNPKMPRPDHDRKEFTLSKKGAMKELLSYIDSVLLERKGDFAELGCLGLSSEQSKEIAEHYSHMGIETEVKKDSIIFKTFTKVEFEEPAEEKEELPEGQEEPIETPFGRSMNGMFAFPRATDVSAESTVNSIATSEKETKGDSSDVVIANHVQTSEELEVKNKRLEDALCAKLQEVEAEKRRNRDLAAERNSLQNEVQTARAERDAAVESHDDILAKANTFAQEGRFLIKRAEARSLTEETAKKSLIKKLEKQRYSVTSFIFGVLAALVAWLFSSQTTISDPMAGLISLLVGAIVGLVLFQRYYDVEESDQWDENLAQPRAVCVA